MKKLLILFLLVSVSLGWATEWSQMGLDIDGEAKGDRSGGAVSMSADGSCIAIGAIYNSDNGDGSGHVRIYKIIKGEWVQLGVDINGEVAGDQSGCSVSLSETGSHIAVGAFGNDGNGINSGHVRVFEYLIHSQPIEI